MTAGATTRLRSDSPERNAPDADIGNGPACPDEGQAGDVQSGYAAGANGLT